MRFTDHTFAVTGGKLDGADAPKGVHQAWRGGEVLPPGWPPDKSASTRLAETSQGGFGEEFPTRRPTKAGRGPSAYLATSRAAMDGSSHRGEPPRKKTEKCGMDRPDNKSVKLFLIFFENIF